MARSPVLLGCTLAGLADDNAVITALGGTPYAIGDGFDTGRNAILRKTLQWRRPINLIRRFYGLDDTLPDVLDEWFAGTGRPPVLTVSQAAAGAFLAYYEMASTTLWNASVDVIADEIEAFIADHAITRMYFGYQHEAGTDQPLKLVTTTNTAASATTMKARTRPGVGVLKALTAGTVLSFGGGLTATVAAPGFTPTLPGGPFPDPSTIPISPPGGTGIPSGSTATIESTAQIKNSFKNGWINFHDRCVARWSPATIAAIRWLWVRVDIDWETLSAADWYPGNAYVDVCGIDFYNDYGRKNNGQWQEFAPAAALVKAFAQGHGKTAAVTELGASAGIPFTVTGGPYGPSATPVTINISGTMVQSEVAGALVRFLDGTVVPFAPLDDVVLNANFSQSASSFQVNKLDVAIATGTTGYVHKADTTLTKGQFFTRMEAPLKDWDGWEFVAYFFFNNEIDEGPRGDAEALDGWVTLVNHFPFVPVFGTAARPAGRTLPGSRSGLGPTGVRRS